MTTRLSGLMLLVASVLGCSGCNQCRDWGEDPWVPGRVVVGFDVELTDDEIDEINAELGTSINICWGPTNYCVIELPAGLGISEALCFYQNHPRVRFALPDSYVSVGAEPDAGS